MPLSVDRLSASPQAKLRFGRYAKEAEVTQIQQTANQAGWAAGAVFEPKFCFVQNRSGFLGGIKGWVGNLLDGARLRWQMWRKGFGVFPNALKFKHPTDVYKLVTYGSADEANKALATLQEASQKNLALKAKMMEKVKGDQGYRNGIGKDLPDVNSSDFGVPASWWQKPFISLFPVDGAGQDVAFTPEHQFPTLRVTKLNDTTLLTRTRLGPHHLEVPTAAPAAPAAQAPPAASAAPAAGNKKLGPVPPGTVAPAVKPGDQQQGGAVEIPPPAAGSIKR